LLEATHSEIMVLEVMLALGFATAGFGARSVKRD
jgi:hypothetical protein